MARQPQPGSLAFSSAQSMADFRRLEEIIANCEKRGTRIPTDEEKAALKAILTRMPPAFRERMLPVSRRLGLV